MTEVIKALQKFFSGFGVTVYLENSVPEEGAVFPYLTYSPVVVDWDSETTFPVRIWDYGGPDFSPQRLAGIVDRIGKEINGGKILTAGTGYIVLDKGTPWAQLQPMQNADVRVAYLNFDIKTIIA